MFVLTFVNYFAPNENVLSKYCFLDTGFADQFDKYDWRTIDDLGKDYDFQSIMHYDRKAFSKNGLPTIVNIYNENMEFGTKDDRLSQKDIIEINALYDCISSKLRRINL